MFHSSAAVKTFLGAAGVRPNARVSRTMLVKLFTSFSPSWANNVSDCFFMIIIFNFFWKMMFVLFCTIPIYNLVPIDTILILNDLQEDRYLILSGFDTTHIRF